MRCSSRRRCCWCRPRPPCVWHAEQEVSMAWLCRLIQLGLRCDSGSGPRLISMFVTKSLRPATTGIEWHTLHSRRMACWFASRCLPSWQRKQPGASKCAQVVRIGRPVDLLVLEDRMIVDVLNCGDGRLEPSPYPCRRSSRSSAADPQSPAWPHPGWRTAGSAPPRPSDGCWVWQGRSVLATWPGPRTPPDRETRA